MMINGIGFAYEQIKNQQESQCSCNKFECLLQVLQMLPGMKT